MSKLVKEKLNENDYRGKDDFIKNLSDEPTIQNNTNGVIDNPIKVKQMYNDRVKGFYLVKAKTEYRKGYFDNDTEANYTDIDNGKFLMFDPVDDESFHDYIENLLGEWSMKNADEWSEYAVVDMSTDGEDQIYSW